MLEQNLKKIISDLGITQAAFAKLCGLPLDRIRNACRGNIQKLKDEELKAIRNATGVRESWLTKGQGPTYLTDQEKSAGSVMDALARATQEIAPLNAEDWVKRTAQEWLFAVYRADAKGLTELATMAAAPRVAEGTPVAALDEALLQGVIEQTLEEIEKQGGQMRPAKLAAVLLSAYQASAARQQVDAPAITRLVKLAT